MDNFVKGPLGVDVSYYQDPPTTPQQIDFNRMRVYGVRFVIIRASQGDWQDPAFPTSWRNAKAAGLPRAAYHFYDPRVSPEVQAHRFTGMIANDPPEGRLWVDLEFPMSWGGEFTDWRHWRTFIEEVKDATGLRVGIYTGNWWWQPYAVERRADLSYFGQYPLWDAQYTSNPAFVTIPRGWTKAMIWQWGTPVIGHDLGVESLEVDANYWNAAYRFEEEWNGMSAPIPPGDENTMQYRVIWPNGVARRTAPTVFNSYTGQVYLNGAIVDVVENNIPDATDPDNPDKKWVKFTDGLYGANAYPTSIGVPQVRMELIEEPDPEPEPEPTPFPPEIGITIGNETRTYVPKA